MKRLLYLLLVICAGTAFTATLGENRQEFTVHPIGWVRKAENKVAIILDQAYQPGLLGLEGFSHVYVLYWFDRNDNSEKRSVLRVHPRGNPRNPLTGVFATRSPARPNLIALSLCKILAIKENTIEIDGIDALPDSPVLDLKPFIPHSEATTASVPDWVSRDDENRGR